MSAVTTLISPDVAAVDARLVPASRRRGMAVFLGLLAVIMLLGFGVGVDGKLHSKFILTASPAVNVAPITMDVRWISIILGIVCAGLAALLFTWRRNRGIYAIFTVGTLVFLWSFLVWAARAGTLNFVSVLAGTLIGATPLIYGSLSGILCERAGVINIAIEGQFLAGAFLGAMIASWTGDLWLGVLCGAGAGAIFGWLLAFLALRYGADQIIIGVVIDAFALGLTNYLLYEVLTPYQSSLNTGITFSNWQIPFLSKIPIVGPVLFDQNFFIYLAMFLLVAVSVGLFRTRWGLRVRAVGEHPRAAETVGLHVIRTRYSNVIIGGALAGVGGAYFTIGSIGEFTTDMSAGLGFVALAAMIFGRWRPYGALGAALLFGFAESLQSVLAILNVGIPAPFLSMAPYVITIAVVSGLVGRVRPPAADGKPYSRE
ncbi:MAG TPA: ABC transporter permease [Acidimicrobiales bacterium]|jgi:simple sugar transport system permease protein|nr:ABC transporter permease [Acidimicrobiales bacterium]